MIIAAVGGAREGKQMRGRFVAAVAAFAATVGGSVFVATTPALAGSISGTTAVRTQLEPKARITGVTPITWVPGGKKLTLQCLTTGEKAYGQLAKADPYYYRVSYSSKTGIVSDSDVYTSKAATQLGLASCSAKAGSPSSGRYNAAIVKAARAVPNYSTANNGNNCALWAEYIIRKAGGPSVALGMSNGSGYNAAWSRYATRVSTLSSAKAGDLIQWYRSGRGPHTSILMSGTSTSSAVVKSGGYNNRYVYQYKFSVDLNYFGSGYYTIWRVR